MFKFTFPILALAAATLSLGGCALTPLHLVGPAAMAIMKLDQTSSAPGRISIDSMLGQVRESGEATAATTTSRQRSKNTAAIEKMLAAARETDVAKETPSETNRQAVAPLKHPGTGVSLAELRSQVLEAKPLDHGTTCK